MTDITTHLLSTTVSRYQRLHLSRRRGNAVRQQLISAGIIEAVSIATASGQVMLCQLTDHGRSVCAANGIDPGPRPRATAEHSFWVRKATEYFEAKGYTVSHEHRIKGNGAVDLLAEREGKRIAVEVETGKSNIKANLKNAQDMDCDQIIFIATSPAAVTACQKVIDEAEPGGEPQVALLTWLDVS